MSLSYDDGYRASAVDPRMAARLLLGETTPSARLTPFYSVDLRVDRTRTYERWSLETYLEIQNATFAQNAEVVTWNYDYSEEELILSSPPLPVFGFKGTW